MRADFDPRKRIDEQVTPVKMSSTPTGISGTVLPSFRQVMDCGSPLPLSSGYTSGQFATVASRMR
jgi:hypothetical protein